MPFGRRGLLTALGATVMTSTVHRSVAAEGAYDQRLTELERTGRVFGLHALTVTRAGRWSSSITARARTRAGAAR